MRRGELAGGDVDVSQSHLPLSHRQADQVVICPAIKEHWLDHRSRCYYANDLAFNNSPGLTGFGNLLTNGNLIATGDESRQVIVQGMVGNAGHRHLVSLAHLP